jgi:hypothetical protein
MICRIFQHVLAFSVSNGMLAKMAVITELVVKYDKNAGNLTLFRKTHAVSHAFLPFSPLTF